MTRDPKSADGIFSQIHTPYDDIIPRADEPSAQFYLDAMRIYLGLCSGTVSIEAALKAVETLKENPEFAKSPTNPTRVPINNAFKERILDNLKTLKKFNLLTRDSVRSAYNFAFLYQESPLNETDYRVLSYLTKDPLGSLVDTGESLSLTPRTIARSIDRLRSRNGIRFSCHMDTTAFNVQSFIMFFTLAPGVEWEDILEGLSEFPFTNAILKTTMTDLGYVSFMIPGGDANNRFFRDQIRTLSPIIFDYLSLHSQIGIGSASNLSLYQNGEWMFSDSMKNVYENEPLTSEPEPPRLLMCRGWQRGLTKEDFAIVSEFRIDARSPPREISTRLRTQDWQLDPRQVAHSLRKLHGREILMPYILFGGVGLSTNFCFEIICDKVWKDRILRAIRALPYVMYYISSKGIIIWAQVSGNHQVDYYQIFRSLEENTGVKSVKPIMTIAQTGSRGLLDLTQYWFFGEHGWDAEPERLKLPNYLM